MIRWVAIIAVVLTVSTTAQAQDRFGQGRMSVGLAAGGGSGFFGISGTFGYFVIDRLRPGVGFAYQYQDFGNSAAHQLKTNLSLRYYIVESDPLSPFVVVDGGHIRLMYTGSLDETHNYFSAAGGAGVHWLVTSFLGFEAVVGAIRYLDVDPVLFDRKAVPEGLSLWYNFGLSLVF